MKTLHPSSTYSLRETIGDCNVVAFNIGPTGEVYLVLALESLDYRAECNGFASFAKTVPDSPQRYRILAFRESRVELDFVVDREPFNIHEVQPITDGLLLACSRSEYRGLNEQSGGADPFMYSVRAFFMKSPSARCWRSMDVNRFINKAEG